MSWSRVIQGSGPHHSGLAFKIGWRFKASGLRAGRVVDIGISGLRL